MNYFVWIVFQRSLIICVIIFTSYFDFNPNTFLRESSSISFNFYLFKVTNIGEYLKSSQNLILATNVESITDFNLISHFFNWCPQKLSERNNS